MGIVTEYLKYQEEYQEKYGERTIILYQNGSFYEVFEYDPSKNEDQTIPPWPSQKIGHATELSKLLGYTLTKRNKNKPYSLSNPNLVGFPCVSFEKHKSILLSKNYTLVIVEQDKPGKNAVRRVTQVLSPATQISDLNPLPVTNQIVSIYIEIQKEAPKPEDYLITVGIASIDVTTGYNIVSETYSKSTDAIYALQETYRFLLSMNPRELIINMIGSKKTDPHKYKEYISAQLELNKYPLCTMLVNNVDKEYTVGNYQQQFLSKVFNPSNKMSPNGLKLNIINNLSIKHDNKLIIEELGLERLYYGIISYIILLQYCYEHNDRLIEKLQKPDTHWIDENNHLIITHNALKQINVLSPPGSSSSKRKTIDSLISTVDNTSTSMGKRYLQNIVCNPLTNTKLINEFYEMTQSLIDNDKLLENITDILKNIPDLERYQRKLQLQIIKPNEFCILFRSYIDIVKLYTIILQSDNDILKKILFTKVNPFNKCLTEVLSKYNLDTLYNAKMENDRIISTNPIFYPGSNPEADDFYSNISSYSNQINSIVDHLNIHLSSTRGKLIEYTSSKKSGKKDPSRALALFTTIHKGNVLKKSSIDTNICGNIQVTTINKEAMITSDIISTVCHNLTTTKDQYEQYVYRIYNKTVASISNQYDFFHDITKFVGKLDYIKSNAISAIKNNYFRPEILEDNTDVSCLEIKNLRHPIVEKIIDNQYITNDLNIGSKPYGLLLYGANSCGKTTLTKAVGLCIIMAQSGMYTPCNLLYTPYDKIITRLSGEDDLLRGKSSFVVEMTELRTILRNADSKTLVLGDELCRGTESLSGTGLTVITIEELVSRKTSFIFSTHMHHLVDNDIIKKLPKNSLRICHLDLKYDEESKNLIYERKLKEGHGESLYGLEVALSLSINQDFIRRALAVRQNMIGTDNKILNTKKSKYNHRVYLDACASCGKKPKGLERLHTHHINEQHKADKKGFIDSFHKDSSFNLISLCDTCHKNIHSNGLKIITHQTPSGNIIKIPLSNPVKT